METISIYSWICMAILPRKTSSPTAPTSSTMTQTSTLHEFCQKSWACVPSTSNTRVVLSNWRSTNSTQPVHSSWPSSMWWPTPSKAHIHCMMTWMEGPSWCGSRTGCVLGANLLTDWRLPSAWRKWVILGPIGISGIFSLPIRMRKCKWSRRLRAKWRSRRKIGSNWTRRPAARTVMVKVSNKTSPNSKESRHKKKYCNTVSHSPCPRYSNQQSCTLPWLPNYSK